MSQPFITFYTPTFRRPQSLAKCLASVGAQTAVDDIEQLVLPDHVGLGIVDGLYGRIGWYAGACRGRYVHVLADDDVLACPEAVERLRAFALDAGEPPVIVVRVEKGGKSFPKDPSGPPVRTRVDMGSYVLRRDVWVRHAKDYGQTYSGDFDHAMTLWQAGYGVSYHDRLFVVGGYGRGRAES